MYSAGEEMQKDDGDQQKVRRRERTTRHQATLADFFEALRNMVCPSTQSDRTCQTSSNETSPAKWKILDHAMGFLLEKEAYLSKLLALKEVYLDDDGGPRILEDVQEKYRRLYSKHCLHVSCRACVPDEDEGHGCSDVDSSDEVTDEAPRSPGSSVPNIHEFEGYLFFYSETLELLSHSGVLSPDQTGLSVVSEAISGLWSSLPPERRVEAQQHALNQSSVSWNVQPEISTSPITGLYPSASHLSQEDLLQDAYDVVQRDMNAASLSKNAALQSSDYKKLSQIYKDISGFLKTRRPEDQERPQLGSADDPSRVPEYDEHLLRCLESFDEDF